jgi:hypothetical protein
MLPSRYHDSRGNGSTHMRLEIHMEKINAKQLAGKLIAEHLLTFDIGDPTKIRKDMKLSQADSTLVFAHFTMIKAELTDRLTRIKVSKKAKLEAGKETPESK